VRTGNGPSPFPPVTVPARFRPFDRLATLVAVVRGDGIVVFANSALEDALGVSRRTIEASQFADNFTERQLLLNALRSAGDNEFAALRYDAWLNRLNHEPLPVHVSSRRPNPGARSSWSCSSGSNRRGRTARNV